MQGIGGRRWCICLWQCKDLGAGDFAGGCGNARNWGQAVVQLFVAMQGIGGQAVMQVFVAKQGIDGQAVVQLFVAMQGIGWQAVVQLVESLCYNAEGTLDIVIDITIRTAVWPWFRPGL